jgi:hypothetical protein
VTWEPTDWERAYNEGRTAQVPVNPAVQVKGRFVRRLRYQDAELRLERRSGRTTAGSDLVPINPADSGIILG